LQATSKASPLGVPLPSSPEDVLLAVPVDKNNLDKGWVKLEIDEQQVKVNGGKDTKTVGGDDSVLNADPRGAGLADGRCLAFRFRGEGGADEGDWHVQVPAYEDEDEGKKEGTGKTGE